MVEGYLRKWVNIIHGWKPRYFILHGDLLTFCDTKGGKKKGTISLKIATISTTPEDPLRLIIHTGTNEIHVRAEDSQDLKKWYQALTQAQQDAFKRDDLKNYPDEELKSIERKLSPQVKTFTKDTNLDALKDKLAELWCVQAEFDETISLVAPKVKTVPNLKESMKKLETLGSDLKYRVTECVSKIEDERKRILALASKLESAEGSREGSYKRRIDFAQEESRGQDYDRPYEENDDDTVFQSFESDDGDDNSEEEKVEENYKEAYQQNRELSIRPNRSEPNSSLAISNGSHRLHPVIKKIITQNPVFLETQPIPKENRRDKLPFSLDLNQKFNVWAVAKELIGKDFTRLAVPVWLNEPLSMLQKLCEQLSYSKLLDIAAQKDDSCLRMAYVMGFAFAYYASTEGRLKKPFNPILGETFEYLPVDGAFRFISEQVSHHPPISAGYAENANFQWWGDTQIKSGFKGTSFEVRTTGSCHCLLKRTQEHFIYKRPATGVFNIILGSMYIDNYGEMPFNNVKTGDTGQLVLKKRGWGDKGAYEGEGWIKDKNGNIRYTLHGKWNSYLTAVDALTKQEIRIWDIIPVIPNNQSQYNFSMYTKQLNYLYEDLVSKLPLTDCRLRPDQRALEYGFFDLARDEKFRLEEKQRARRKELQNKGETHKTRWFEEIKDPITGEKSYSYLGGYFESREKGNFGETLDLFS